MKDLNLVCKELLIKSSLSITLDPVTSSIKLIFNTQDKQSVIQFLCHEYIQLDIVKRKDHDHEFTASEVTVDTLTEQQVIESLFAQHGWEDVETTSVEPLYSIQIRGEIAIDIVCAKFAWKQDDNDFIVPTLPHLLM